MHMQRRKPALQAATVTVLSQILAVSCEFGNVQITMSRFLQLLKLVTQVCRMCRILTIATGASEL